MSENKYSVLFKHILEKVKKSIFTKDFLIFLFFVLISTAFWFMNVSGRKREYDLVFKVQYVGIPQNILIESSLQDEISVRIKDYGINVFNYAIREEQKMVVDLSHSFVNDTLISYSKDRLKELILHYLNENTSIVSMPEGISAVYRKQAQKMLKVRLSGNIPLSAQVTLLDSVSVSPSSVLAYGSKSVLDTLRFAYVEPVTEEVKSTKTVQLKLAKIKNVTYASQRDVTATIPVELTTEKKVSIPVRGQNFPWNVSLHAFPPTVDVVFSVGLSKFNEIGEKNFFIYLDYNELKENATGKIAVQVISENLPVKNLRYYPQEVEFLLEDVN